MNPENATAPEGTGAEAESEIPEAQRLTQTGDAEQALEEIRRWERAARVVADDSELGIRQKCAALLDMAFRARRRDLGAFLDVAIWRGCRHLFEPDVEIPPATIDAIRRLLRQGHYSCPSCRRPLPQHEELDHWRELTHNLRRPA